jgi:hypothetical protein
MFLLPMNSSAASTGKVGSATVLGWPMLLSAPMMRVSPALETFSGARASSGATAGVNKTFAVTEGIDARKIHRNINQVLQAGFCPAAPILESVIRPRLEELAFRGLRAPRF